MINGNYCYYGWLAAEIGLRARILTPYSRILVLSAIPGWAQPVPPKAPGLMISFPRLCQVLLQPLACLQPAQLSCSIPPQLFAGLCPPGHCALTEGRLCTAFVIIALSFIQQDAEDLSCSRPFLGLLGCLRTESKILSLWNLYSSWVRWIPHWRSYRIQFMRRPDPHVDLAWREQPWQRLGLCHATPAGYGLSFMFPQARFAAPHLG